MGAAARALPMRNGADDNPRLSPAPNLVLPEAITAGDVPGPDEAPYEQRWVAFQAAPLGHLPEVAHKPLGCRFFVWVGDPNISKNTKFERALGVQVGTKGYFRVRSVWMGRRTIVAPFPAPNHQPSVANHVPLVRRAATPVSPAPRREVRMDRAWRSVTLLEHIRAMSRHDSASESSIAVWPPRQSTTMGQSLPAS